MKRIFEKMVGDSSYTQAPTRESEWWNPHLTYAAANDFRDTTSSLFIKFKVHWSIFVYMRGKT